VDFCVSGKQFRGRGNQSGYCAATINDPIKWTFHCNIEFPRAARYDAGESQQRVIAAADKRKARK
jgi:hypothetical protein